MKKVVRKNKVAISAMASWAWGVSIVVGVQILQQRGYIAYLIWAIANSLALPVYDVVHRKLNAIGDILTKKPVKVYKIIIQLFCVYIQLTAIRQVGGSTGLIPGIYGIVVPIILGVLSIVMVAIGGLRRAINNNIWQFALIIAGCLFGIFAGLLLKRDVEPMALIGNGRDITWAVWSAAMLFTGPFVDHQHYQRVRYAEKVEPRAYRNAGILFGVYMVLVLIFAHYTDNTMTGIAFMVVTFGVALSTLDSAVTALVELTGRVVGAALSAAVIVLFAVLQSGTVMDVWSINGSIRVFVVAAILVYAVAKERRMRRGI